MEAESDQADADQRNLTDLDEFVHNGQTSRKGEKELASRRDFPHIRRDMKSTHVILIKETNTTPFAIVGRRPNFASAQTAVRDHERTNPEHYIALAMHEDDWKEFRKSNPPACQTNFSPDFGGPLADPPTDADRLEAAQVAATIGEIAPKLETEPLPF